ncbi:MAG: capsular polysaccharide biosynthesis protein, partial [Campylobacterales bacterium]|nr:capsular polysaccharide biosynthesis protein [Campylobacterales bacterium]
MNNRYSTSNQLIKNTKNFLNIKHYSFFDRIFPKKGVFYGWGRKPSGIHAMKLAKKMGTSYFLLEDGFIRSLSLGVDGSPSFSLVEDDLGIYYDATAPSRLEMILSTYDFENNSKLMSDASRAIELIVKHQISKYNNAKDTDENYFEDDSK